MEYKGIWAVSIKEIQKFFDKQEDIIYNGTNYTYKTCQIVIEKLEPKPFLNIPQTQIFMCGEEKDTQEIYQKFFFHFLSAGG